MSEVNVLRMPRIAGICCFALACLAFSCMAQDVRPLLRFGMTEAEAKQAVRQTGKLRSLDIPQAANPKMYTGATLLPIEMHGLVGETHLIFSIPTKRLSWINMNLYLQEAADPNSFEDAKWKFIKALMRTHGQPTGRNGCRDAADDCTLIWSNVKERVEFMTFSNRAAIVNYLAPGFRDAMK